MAMTRQTVGHAASPCPAPAIPTPLEKAEFGRLPKNREIVAFLRRLCRVSPDLSAAAHRRSAGGRQILAVRARRGSAASGRLRVMIVGSQHGRETSGAEALQMVVRDFAERRLPPALLRLDLLVLPCANPDGRDLERQNNANKVNLNSDYVLLSQPESRAISAAIDDFRPHVLLDVHESSLLKRRTLGKEGYLTDFEAQFDPACHPAIDDGLRRLGLGLMLPRVLAAVNARGLDARRYVGEISSVRATISHGSLSARKLRSHAGLRGVLAMLLENRLDRSDEVFPTPRNIAVRAAKQYLSIVAFLETCAELDAQIVAGVEAAMRRLANAAQGYRLPLDFEYASDRRKPEISLPYRRIRTGECVLRTQPYRGRVAVTRRVRMPKALAVTRHRQALAKLLDRHGIRYAVLRRPQRGRIAELWPAREGPDAAPAGAEPGPPTVAERIRHAVLTPGDLWIDLGQPAGRLAALILDPRSSDSVFRMQPWRSMLGDGEAFPVVPVLEET